MKDYGTKYDRMYVASVTSYKDNSYGIDKVGESPATLASDHGYA